MKKLILFFSFVPVIAFALISNEEEFAINRLSGAAQKYQLGSLLHKNLNVVVGKYSFAKQGGVTGDINLLNDITDSTSTVVIPDNAVVKQVYIDVITQPTGGSTSTVAVKLQTAADLLGATAIASVTGQLDGTPDGSAANMVKLTADRTLKTTIGTADLTGGQFNVYVEYVLGD